MTTPDQSVTLAQSPKSVSLEEQRATLRERLQRRFEVWLDEALNPEAIPQGLAANILDQLDAQTPMDASGPAGDEDLQAICAALVGLTDTTRLQGTAFEKLHQDLPDVQGLTDTVSTLLDNLATDRKIQAQERQQQAEKQRIEARRQVFQEVLGTVIDMRDRLSAGHTEAQTQLTAIVQAASAPKKRWWQRSPKKQPSLAAAPGHTGLEAVTKANQLAIEGIDQALTRWHVELIEGTGQPLDPETMKVVDQSTHSDMPHGTVVKVLRTGYRWNGTLCRAAEVCVATSPSD